VKQFTIRLALLLCFTCTAIAQPPGPLPPGVTSKLLLGGLLRFDRITGPRQLPAFWERVLAQFSWTQKAGKTLPFNRSVAFLVGVANYKTLKPSLDFVDSDLTELRNFLLTSGGFDTVFELRNENVHKSLIEDYMMKTFTKESADLGSQDRFLFYYSGHGADQFGLGYLQFFGATAGNFLDDVLQASTVRDWARINVAKHVLIILDACASGLALQPKEAGMDAANSLSSDPSGLLLTAGLAEQRAWQVKLSSREGYSVFTHYLLQALRDGLDEKRPFVNIIEVFGRAKDEVAQFRSDEGVIMDPQWGPLTRRYENAKGTFVFLNPKGKNASVPSNLKGALVAKGEADELALLPLERLPGVVGFDPLRDSTDPAAMRLYVDLYKDFPGMRAYVALINARIDELAPRLNPKDGLTYVWIPPGHFTMGCSPGDAECYGQEKPAHEVTISKGFRMGQTEVTQEAYQRVMGKSPNPIKVAGLPVQSVTWSEATEYCGKMGLRLPTEAEWEYAARARNKSGRSGPLDSVAWYGKNSAGTAHPVKGKDPNVWGLYDMLGNVWEWTADWYGAYQEGSATDPKGPSGGQYKVQRGGSWYGPAAYSRVSERYKAGQSDPNNINTGLRCVWDQP
jgi:formylglycine-generating enzyme required for sulfatase activity